MKQVLGLRRLLGAAACTLAVAACDDNSVSSIGECDDVQQTAADAEAGRSSGLARVRVNVVSRLGVDAANTESIGIGGVELYQGGKCLRLATTSTPALGSLENDMGGTLAEAAVELGEITHVLLRPASGADGARHLTGDKIALSHPVHLEPGMRTEIYLALDSVAGSASVATRFVAAGPVPVGAARVMVAEPGRGGSMTTPGGFSMDLPGGSMTVPTVYSVVEHDVGGVAPLLEIAPEGALGAPARIRFRMDRGRLPQGLTMADYGATVGGKAAASTLSGSTVTMDVQSLGLTGMGTQRGVVEFSDGTRMAMPASASAGAAGGSNLVNNTCSQRLAANRSYYYGQVQQHAGVRVSDCETVPPYVHIILVNMSYPNSTISYPKILFPANWYTNTNNFILHTISELGNNYGGPAFAVVNGFYWNGDEGTASGQTGTPAGTVYIDGVKRSTSISGAEAVIGFTTSYSNTGTSAALFSKAAGGSVSLGSYSTNAVSSTTSIVKSGACSRTSTETQDYNTWSALGFGNGIMVMASSTSGNTTTAYELCSVFEGLNVLGGAIRLDGGPSAAIFWLGSHLNPLTGLAYYKYGNARYLAYGIGARQ